MKFPILLIILFLITSCSSKKYLLEGDKKENKKLIEFISQMKKQDKIKKDPVIVINEQVMKDADLKNLKVKGSDIQKLSLIEKGKTEMTEIYGEQAINGVILIETMPSDYSRPKQFEDSKVIIFLDGKEVDKSILKTIDPKDIKTITVIKDEKEVKKYTSKKCDGVILIISKKKKG